LPKTTKYLIPSQKSVPLMQRKFARRTIKDF